MTQGRNRLSSALLATAAILTAVTGVARAAAIDAVPEPQSVQALAGPPLVITDGVVISAPMDDAAALATARYLSDLARRTRGLDLPVADAGPRRSAIRLQRRPGLRPEGYVLEIDAGGARVTASDDAGLFYGAITLWQLLTPAPGRGPVRLAPMRIEDHPRFVWRGLMIDSARHFQPPVEIERMIDAMALHKLNVLHWHLTDDQGWRLQIRKYPRLTEVGAWRTPAPGSPDGAGPYGGYYTQDEVRRIVAYAEARHITVVPEIEMPGHALSALLAYPQFGAGAAPRPQDQANWGVLPYVYGVDEASLGFARDVLTEVMELFPGRDIHVGGDEAERERWNASPAAQARLAELGGVDPAALQADFTRKIARFLQAHGRRLVGWDEILEGGELPGDAVVTSWHGVAGALAAAAKGHDAVLAPAPTLYLDNRQGLGPDEPPGRGYLVALKDVYGFEPLPAGAKPEIARHILGLQANIWTEHVRTGDNLEAMAFPRLAAAAEDGWTDSANKSWSGFVGRLPALFGRYQALGLKADAAAVSVRIVRTAGATGETITLSNQAGVGEIRYALDGQQPGPSSPRYETPLPLARPTRLSAALFLDGARVGPVAEARLDPHAAASRVSQDLQLCNDGLALNLEGGAAAAGRTYLVNPVNACWIWTKAELGGVHSVEVTFARLAFNYGMGSQGSVMVRPARQPTGEIEVRQDSCDQAPVAVADLPRGATGDRTTLRLGLPARSGLHDLCFTFTAPGYDPVLALEQVRLLPTTAEPAP
jgi:hexosaminidase